MAASDQSTKQFCHERGLAHSSFCQWRKRLKQDSASPAFIDLSSLEQSSSNGWSIVLRLGNGIESALMLALGSQARI